MKPGISKHKERYTQSGQLSVFLQTRKVNIDCETITNIDFVHFYILLGHCVIHITADCQLQLCVRPVTADHQLLTVSGLLQLTVSYTLCVRPVTANGQLLTVSGLLQLTASYSLCQACYS